MSHGDGVYTRKDREGYWTWWIDGQGRRKWEKLKANTLKQARAVRAAKQNRVEQATMLGFTPPGEDSFAEVAKRFLAHQKVRITKKAYERERGIVEEHLSKFFTGRVAAIRRVDVQRYITKRSGEKLSPDTVRKELNSLKHLLKLAVEWEIIPTNPAQGVKGPSPQPGRIRYLQPTELRALLEAAPEWLRPIIGLAATTGMRRSEILRIRWLDVDATNKVIHLPRTKNGEARQVYLNGNALMIIKSLTCDEQTRPTDKLFSGISEHNVSMKFTRLCRALHIEDFRLHDLRHTAASWLRMKGQDIHTVAQQLGQKDLRMAARYQHLSPQFMGEAVRALDEAYGDLCYPGVTETKVLTAGGAGND